MTEKLKDRKSENFVVQAKTLSNLLFYYYKEETTQKKIEQVCEKESE